MGKRLQRGGSDTNDITSNPIISLSGALVSIFSVIIPILLYMKYEFIVKIFTGIYGFFLFIFSVGVVSTDLIIAKNYSVIYKTYIDIDNPTDDKIINIQKTYYSTIMLDSVLFGFIAVISIGMVVLSFIYKHSTFVFPLTIGLILSIVLIRIFQVPLNESRSEYTILKVVMMIFACVTLLFTILSQLYINTSGGGSGNGGDSDSGVHLK
jgi:hypothetical protein